MLRPVVLKRTNMNVFIYALVALATISTLTQAQRLYRAALVEYAPDTSIQKNVENYRQRIEEAANAGAQIIVFPEVGLNTWTGTVSEEYATFVPHPNETVTPYMNKTNYSDALIRLSEAAMNHKIVVVVNLLEKAQIEKNGTLYFFNTNVVLDPFGAVIGRYRKENLFDEGGKTSGKGFNDESSYYFNTPFGVKFGMFTCFDILFKKPGFAVGNAVTDVVFPTAWFSEVPFLSALSVQAGFARAHGINLIAADYSSPSDKLGGSGIYSLNGTSKVSVPTVPSTRTLYLDLPVTKEARPQPSYNSAGPRIGTLPSVDSFVTSVEDLSSYEFASDDLVANKSTKTSVCSGGDCCDLQITIDRNNTPDLIYRLVMKVGTRKYGSLEANIRTCGIVACDSHEKSTCGKRTKKVDDIVIKSMSLIGRFSKKETFYFPSTLKTSLEPIANGDYSYEVREVDDKYLIKMDLTTPQTSVLTFAIYGRDEMPSSASNFVISTLMVALSALLAFYRQ